MVRLSVRQQLTLLLIFSGGIGLAVLAIANWVTSHEFILNITKIRLETTAIMKASQLASNMELLQTAATFVSTRALVQRTLASYDSAQSLNTSDYQAAQADLDSTLGNVGPITNALVLQAMVFSRNTSGPAGKYSLLNSTGTRSESIGLPWNLDNGTQAYLGDTYWGYPPDLYPNLTISKTANPSRGDPNYVASYNGFTIYPNNTLVLGPLQINQSFALLSMTIAMTDTTNITDVLGWITVTADARLIQQQLFQDQTGLGDSTQVLLLGPVNSTNLFPPGVLGSPQAGSTDVRYLIPLNQSASKRHPDHVYGTANPAFPANNYPAVADAIEADVGGTNGCLLRTHNEENVSVSVGYAVPPSNLVDWIVLVEQSRGEVWEPINQLRAIILACLFGVVGFLSLVSFPLAHWFIRPLLWVRAASEETVHAPDWSGNSDSSSQTLDKSCTIARTGSAHSAKNPLHKAVLSWRAWKQHIFAPIINWRHRRNLDHVESRADDEKTFRIPGKVKVGKRWIKDEMTDLINTFNEMSDELFMQYTKLEDRVRQRTIELEHSKKAAEAANESKTLFVANVSHELKTPLNGILGMCAVCMEEEDPSKLRRSLGIIYKSGDLLLRTLNDLLTFSTNQVGHQILTLEEREFQLRDLETQVVSIFGDQAKDRKISLTVVFEDMPAEVYGKTGRLRDITLWGDIHRLLQVVINLVSNSLKFTPEDGSVTVTIRCLKEKPSRRQSVQEQSQKKRGSVMIESTGNATANFINPRGISQEQDKTASPPGKDIFIEFEVKDTGPGIAPEDQHKIFEPFVQGSQGLSRKHSGTGLGLSICSQLANLMRGSIGVHSKLGEGSTFWMKVPLRHVVLRLDTSKSSQASVNEASSAASRRNSPVLGEKPEAVSLSRQSTGRSSLGAVVTPAHAPTTILVDTSAISLTDKKGPDATTSSIGNKQADTPLKQAVIQATKEARVGKKQTGPDFSSVKVLVAEDNKVNQEVILRMLKLEKITDVTIAEDGQQAFDLVKTKSAPGNVENVAPESPFDLIFMDVQMPNMDGLTSTKLIRETGFSRPIVALTAFAEQSNIDECYGSGMDYFLAKPIKRPMLKKVLTDYCTPSPCPDAGNATLDGSTNPVSKGEASKANGEAPTTEVVANVSKTEERTDLEHS